MSYSLRHFAFLAPNDCLVTLPERFKPYSRVSHYQVYLIALKKLQLIVQGLRRKRQQNVFLHLEATVLEWALASNP
jgi:hypothetical protein